MGKKVEAVTDFIFLGSKITADGDSSHKIKRCLLLRRKGMTNLDSILKSRDISLLTKVCQVKAMVFLVVMFRCESWTRKCWACKNWCFWTVVLDKTLEFPLTARRSNQSILNIEYLNIKYSILNIEILNIHWKDWWSWSFSTLAIWCEQPTYWKWRWSWERLKAGGEGENRG